MKLVIVVIIAFAVAVGLALVSINDPGYVVLSREPYVVRLPLLMFVLIIALGFVLFYLLFNFIVGIFRTPKRFGKWQDQRNESSAHKHTMLGYAGLIEGNWSKAEASLLKNLEHNKTPLMNYLGAAYAAQQQGDLVRRNQYLDEALEKYPRQKLPIDLTRARLLYQAGEVLESRNCLEGLRIGAPRNIPVVRLLAETYNDLGDWSSLVELVSTMKKLNAFPAEELKRWERLAYDNSISSPTLLQGELDRSTTIWNSLPSAKRKEPELVASYVRQLIKEGKSKEAEKALRTALNKKFDSELIYLYGKVESPFLEYQIQLAESLTKNNKDHPDLLLTLARLYRYNKEDEKAKEYFKQALAAGGREEAYLDLGSLLEQMGDNDGALFFMKKGLAAINPKIESVTESDIAAGEIVLIADGGGAVAKDVIPVVR